MESEADEDVKDDMQDNDEDDDGDILTPANNLNGKECSHDEKSIANISLFDGRFASDFNARRICVEID